MTYNLKQPHELSRLQSDIARLAAAGKRITIKECHEVRSINQNRLYWLWLTCIADETGNDKDVLHEFFKQKYLAQYEQEHAVFIKEIPSYYVNVKCSTADLDTKDMSLYLDCIHAFALTECGITLPKPNEQGWQEFYEKYKNFITH